LTGSFAQPNQLGSFCALALLVALGVAFGARTRAGRIAAAAGGGVIFVGLLLSYSRGAWIGVAVGAVTFTIATPAARRALAVVAIPAIVLVASTGSFARSHPELRVIQLRAEAITSRSPYDARTSIWREALHEAETHPLTGVGPGNFPVTSTRAISEASTVAPAHAHNIWLNWAAEAGLPAAVLIAGFAAVLAAAARRTRKHLTRLGRRRDSALVAGIAAGLVSILVQGMVDYTLRNAVNLYATWAVIGILLAFVREVRAERE
jgi:O-antigen ligase